MQDAANRADDSFDVIVADLIALVEHVQASIDLIDGAISREASLGEPDTGNVIVLDDVTPQYLKASYALNTCGASLDAALKTLLEREDPPADRPTAEASSGLHMVYPCFAPQKRL